MAALCYADKFVTERTDNVSEVLIEDSMMMYSKLHQINPIILNPIKNIVTLRLLAGQWLRIGLGIHQ